MKFRASFVEFLIHSHTLDQLIAFVYILRSHQITVHCWHMDADTNFSAILLHVLLLVQEY